MVASPIGEGFRLSPQQRKTWLLAAEGRMPRIAAMIDVAAALAPAALAPATLAAVVARHEALRTRFIKSRGLKLPLQVVDDVASFGWREDDLAGLDAAAAAERLAVLFEEELERGFDAARGPVLEARLAHRGGGRATLLLSVPAVCGDAASLALLVAELAALGNGTELGEPLQYVDFCDWQEEFLASAEPAPTQGRSFWERRRSAVLRSTTLPFARPVASRATATRGTVPPAVVPVRFAPGLGARLAARADTLGTDPAALVRAAWWVLVARLSGEEELVLGELFSGRTDAELASAFGPFARLLPLGCRLADDLRCAQAVDRIERARRESEAHQHAYAEPEDAGSILVLAFEAHRSQLSGLRGAVEGAALKLAVLLGEEPGADPAAELVYDPRRFDPDEVAATARWLGRFLEHALDDPETRLRDLPLLDAGERAALLAAGAQPTGTTGTTGTECVHQRIEAWAERTPAAAAVCCEDEEIAFGELNRRANRLARHLRGLGVDTETPVILFLERSVDLMVAMLAALKAGGAYVALDVSQPRRRVEIQLESFETPLVITQTGLVEQLPIAPAVVLERDREVVERCDAANLPCHAVPESLAYVVFTSGSTGKPKGVGVEHRQLLSYVDGVFERLGLAPGLSFASVSTFSADLGHTSVFGALARGGCLHLLSQERATDPRALADYFGRHRVDCLKIVPSHFEALQAGAETTALLPKRCLVVGGEASKRVWAEGLRLEAERGGCRFFNHYGPSETTVGVLTHPIDGELDPRSPTVPIGRPIPGVRAHVLDRAGAPVPAWSTGELLIGGTSVSRGYLGQPRPTAERFVPDPLAGEPGARCYRTGDQVRMLPGGAIEFLGRRDHQVKFHGFRVELGELRNALNTHPQIRDSVVRLMHEQDGRDLLVAYYVARQEIPFAELRQHLGRTVLEETLPNLFVHLRRLPLSLNGKVNLDALPGIEEARRKIERPFVLPRTATEAMVAEIWAQVLPPERVSVEDNFFELGGHSLLATRIIARLRESCGVEVPLRALFETPTVAALARWVDEHPASSAVPALATIERAGATDILAQLDELEGGGAG